MVKKINSEHNTGDNHCEGKLIGKIEDLILFIRICNFLYFKKPFTRGNDGPPGDFEVLSGLKPSEIKIGIYEYIHISFHNY